jgi:hypothetical protein
MLDETVSKPRRTSKMVGAGVGIEKEAQSGGSRRVSRLRSW